MKLSLCNMLGPKMVTNLRSSVTTLTIMGPKMIDKCTLITKMVPNICANLWVPLDYHIGSMINLVLQYTSKVQDSIHKTILGPNILHRPISGPCKNTRLWRSPDFRNLKFFWHKMLFQYQIGSFWHVVLKWPWRYQEQF